MTFTIILVMLINGDPFPWAGFQDLESCEMVRANIRVPKAVTTMCVQPKRA